MNKSRKILLVGDVSYNPVKMFLDQVRKLAKGFIRLGHDVRIFNYRGAMERLSFSKSKTISKFFYKDRVDDLLAEQVKHYDPQIIFISFSRVFDDRTIQRMRQAAPKAVFVGNDGDPWPKLQKNRIETAKQLDIVIATNDGQFLQDYRDAGVPLCAFMPNLCDPDTDHRYNVSDEFKSNILWTGKTGHHADTSDTFRKELVTRLAERNDARLYGCLDRPKIGGIDYLHAISGAKIGANVNAVNSVRMYHSDRFTHYLMCGAFVLAKRVPDTDLLFADGKHLRYFDEIDEFFELADWYLGHEDERIKIADAGMQRAHEQFNCEKIAGYILELIETGDYAAPWRNKTSGV